MDKIEIVGPEKLVQEENKRTYKDKMKAKEIFETEIVPGRIYFEFNNKKYYIRKSTRQDSNDIITFREDRKLKYLLDGLMTQSQAEKIIRELYEKYPPIVYKVKYIKHGSEEKRVVKYLTDEEEEIFKECYQNKIYEIEEIKEKLNLSKNIDLQITPCASAYDLLQNTVEMRASADATEWDIVKRVCHASGESKDKPLYNTYEDFLNDENSIDITKEIARVISEDEKNAKKK